MTQTATSTLYALLNEITRNNRESYPAANGTPVGAPSLFPNGAALDVSGLTDSEREQICVSALSGIIGIAKHLEDDSVRFLESKPNFIILTPVLTYNGLCRFLDRHFLC